MKKYVALALFALVALVAASCGKKAEQASTPPLAETPRVEARLLKQWLVGLSNRRPGLDAKMMNHLGDGALGVNVTGEASAWYEKADIDSNGTEETVSFMWDATNKVLYAYTQDPITVSDGTVADKGLLVTTFGQNNTRGRDMGSGWWAYALTRDTTTTGTVEGTLYGCRFDNTGTVIECGNGTFARDQNDFTIEAKPQ